MADLQIITIPDPRLTMISTDIAEPASVKSLAQEMILLMEKAGGVGLAAPQVGLNIRLFVASETGKAADASVYINPKFLCMRGMEVGEEGCLSIPFVLLPILRHTEVEIEAFDIDGDRFRRKAFGMLSKILQHEYDHLSGILITSKPYSSQHFAPLSTFC